MYITGYCLYDLLNVDPVNVILLSSSGEGETAFGNLTLASMSPRFRGSNRPNIYWLSE